MLSCADLVAVAEALSCSPEQLNFAATQSIAQLAAAARKVALEDVLAAVVEIRGLCSEVVRATDGMAEIASDTNEARQVESA